MTSQTLTPALGKWTKIRVIARPHLVGTYVRTYPVSGLVDVRWDDHSLVLSVHKSQIEAVR